MSPGRDTYLIQTAASTLAAGLVALNGPGERRKIANAERKRKNKLKALAKKSKKRNRT